MILEKKEIIFFNFPKKKQKLKFKAVDEITILLNTDHKISTIFLKKNSYKEIQIRPNKKDKDLISYFAGKR